jgi:hypothetical protein
MPAEYGLGFPGLSHEYGQEFIFRNGVQAGYLPTKRDYLPENWYGYHYPKPRLHADFMQGDGLKTYQDNYPGRYDYSPDLIPELLRSRPHDSEKGWEMDKFISSLFGKDRASQMLHQAFIPFLHSQGESFYRAYKASHPNDYINDDGACQPAFAHLIGSNQLGCFLDKLYSRIGLGLQVLADTSNWTDDGNTLSMDDSAEITQFIHYHWSDQAIIIAGRGGKDIDMAIARPEGNQDPHFIENAWCLTRNKKIQVDDVESEDGTKGRMYTGFNYQVIEHPNEDGNMVYEGWKLIRDFTYDNTPIVILESGIFKCPNDFNPWKENSLKPVQITTTIDLTEMPQEFDPTDSRYGDVSIADSRLFLPVKSMSKTNMDFRVSIPYPTVWDTFRYGRYRLNLINSPAFFDYKPALIEKTIRALKHLTLRVGFFDLSKEVTTAADFQINDSLWKFLTPDLWNEYLITTFLASAHLSPFVFAAHLIPDKYLNDLPEGLKRKLAIHGIDGSLSLGNLWPDLFNGILQDNSPEETRQTICTFLNAVPNQEQYLREYFEHPEKRESQGLYHIMTALKNAGIKIPEFDSNVLLQANYVFRHPDDNVPLMFADMDNFLSGRRTTKELKERLLYFSYLKYPGSYGRYFLSLL